MEPIKDHHCGSKFSLTAFWKAKERSIATASIVAPEYRTRRQKGFKAAAFCLSHEQNRSAIKIQDDRHKAIAAAYTDLIDTDATDAFERWFE